jgi:type IV pilus assembly protein PilW
MVELMVAIVLSLLVADAAVSLFLANKKTAGTTTGVADISDNGRFALDVISESVRSAGYMACSSLNAGAGAIPLLADTPQTSVIVVPPTATPVQYNYGGTSTAIAGYEAAGTGPSGSAVTVAAMPVSADLNPGDWTGGLDPLLMAGTPGVPGVLTGTDVLVVREQKPESVTMYTVGTYTPGGTLTVNDASSLAGVGLPHAIVVSTCGASYATMLSGVTGNVLTLATPLPPTAGIGPNSSVALIDTLIYYIGPGRDGDGALFLWDDGSSPTAPFSTELVPDVENMQVLYGVAPTNPTQVTAYETANTVAAAVLNNQEFNQVISVKVALLLASPPGAGAIPTPAVAPTFTLLNVAVTPPLDNRLRKVFDVTIAARNASH